MSDATKNSCCVISRLKPPVYTALSHPLDKTRESLGRPKYRFYLESRNCPIGQFTRPHPPWRREQPYHIHLARNNCYE